MSEIQKQKDNYLKFINEENSEYNLEVLSKDDSYDFQLIEESFNNTIGCTNICLTYNFKIERICRVVQKNRSRKPEDFKRDRTLMFHGTPRQNVPSILRFGFISSVKGRFGRGVYHSNYFSKCTFYARTRNSYDRSHFFFVNEIPANYITEKHEYDYNEVLPEFYCHKYLTIPNFNEQYAPDSNGSFINITKDEKIDGLYPNYRNYNIIPEFVASENIVIPKYHVHATKVMKKLVTTLFIL